MQTLYSHFRRINLLPVPEQIKPHLSSFSSSVYKTKNHPHNSFLLNYLIQNFNFPEERAQCLANRYYYVKSPVKPQSVVHYFETLGFSPAHIRSSIRVAPEILFHDVDKNLKPKIELLQGLGLVGSQLSKFLSKNSTLLAVSLEKRLIPNIEILKKKLVSDKNNKDLIRVITRCGWVLAKDPKWRLLSNIKYFESCGIVGSQLSLLLKRQPRLFITEESKLRYLVSRTLDMGFSVNSRMLVHGFHVVSCLSEETLERKLQLLSSFGFSEDECKDMFRRSPGCLSRSEEKLKLALDFFLYKMLTGKEVLFLTPVCLSYSLEDRVIPRYRVMQILKSKGLLKKELSVSHMIILSEDKFLKRFVAKFRDDAEELLMAYKGHMLDSSSSNSNSE